MRLPLLIAVCCALGILHVPAVAAGRTTIVVLAFGGEGADSARSSIVEALSHRYEVLHGQKLLDACDQLGISMSRGANLAKAAAHLGAVAVIGGSMKGGHLALAVYSGKTGQPLVTGTVPASGGLAHKNLGKALAILTRGLAKAPKKMPRPHVPKGAGGGGGGKTGGGGGGGGGLVFEPDPVEASGSKNQQREEMDENPLANKGEGGEKAPAPTGGGTGVFGGPAPVTTPAPVVAKKPEEEGGASPKVYATLGFGTWLRSFEMNDPQGTAPKYTSGATFALRLDLGVRPAAFFTDNFLGNLYLHFRFQQTLGLESRQKDKTTGAEETFGTTLREIAFDLGYDWKILSSVTSPHVGGGLGYGMMDFNIDYGRDVDPSKDMPGAGYRYVLLDIFFRWPFWAFSGGFLGAHLGFDYRACVGSGDIEQDQWYGPASTGGINLALGMHASWKKIIASFEYGYTRYFQAFTSDPADRTSQGKKVAGGALDNQHELMINVGYSY